MDGRLTREDLKRIKRLPIRELDTWIQNYYAGAYEDGRQVGYAEGLTADLDGDEFIVMDEDEAKKRIAVGLLGGEE